MAKKAKPSLEKTDVAVQDLRVSAKSAKRVKGGVKVNKKL